MKTKFVLRHSRRLLVCLVSLATFATLHCAAWAEDISSSGWRLWSDREAAWKNDDIFLPSEVRLSQLPVNAPTGGWQALNNQQGINVTLPSTVEEHFWGKFGTRPYTKNEAQRGEGTSFQNGNYLGVSWWWRDISIPKFKPGQRVVVAFRGARLRAEVYCNGKLCGYTIMTELPFEADLTDAVKPGDKTQLAVRITNPGGHLDWIDFAQMRIQWGKYQLPPSHGFGGLDNGIQLAIRDDVAVTDLAAINTPDLKRVRLVAEVSSHGQDFNGPVQFKITRKGKTVWRQSHVVTVAAGQTQTIELEAQVDSAQPWDLANPNLYQASASLDGLKASERNVSFGFRFFTAEGIGTSDAKLTLNGKRIVPISSISWGYWGRNGLWPDQEMAEREVSAAKAMGLSCLHFHRNIGKPAVLDVQDRMGLLRVEEPGGGKFALGHRYAQGPFGPNGEFLAKDEELLKAFAPAKDYVEPENVDTSGSGADGDAVAFWEKYMEEKILAMVKRDRSHPSLIAYNIQNESNELDIRNPRIYRLFRRMHQLDPSRIITLFSGGVPKNEQVLMLPYNDEIRYGSKTLPFAGWRDVHTCGGPCNYLDHLYKNPRDCGQRQPEEAHKAICIWGEALGAATVDDYDTLVNAFDAKHPTGYELDDMQKVLNGYREFIDKYGFRKAFPTESALFQAIGFRTYFFWQRIVEQSRMDNANDMLVISGWESTTIDNHSGLLDNHRFFKGDPTVIAQATKPEMLVIQPRRVIVAKGEKNLVDVFLLNEVNRTGPQTLKLTAKNADGSIAFTTEKAVVAFGGDTYGQLLVEAIELPPASMAGMLTIQATMTAQDSRAKPLTRTGQIEVVDVDGKPVFKVVAVFEPQDEITKTLLDVFNVTPTKFSDVPAQTKLDAIVIASKSVSRDFDMSKEVLTTALDRVQNDGTRLVLWPDNNFAAEGFAKQLGRLNVLKYSRNVGSLNAPWFGSWFFVRKHWLLDGLPTDCAMDWRYGISAFSGPAWLNEQPPGGVTDGFVMDAPGIEAFVGYGADHNANVGISGCVIPYGKGQIVFYCLPQLVRSLQAGEHAINQVICQQLLGNALRPSPTRNAVAKSGVP